MRHFLHLIFIVIVSHLNAMADDASKPAANYQVDALPINIAPTVAVLPHTDVQVVGQPRMTKGHPCTLWDQEDINHYKEMLKTSKELQFQLAEMKAQMDEVIATPVTIPPPPPGKTYPGDYFPPLPGQPNLSPQDKFRGYVARDCQVVGSLGILYALTGEEKYGEYAKQLILAYAHTSQFNFPGVNYRNGSGIISNTFIEAQYMDYFAFGYDLIYNLPSWTPEEHARVHDELLRPVAEDMLYPGVPEKPEVMNSATQPNNRGAFCATYVLWAGYATDDQELVNAALYGIHPTSSVHDNVHCGTFPAPKDWTVGTAENPSRGLLDDFFAPTCIPGGMWVEGTPGYAFYALGSMVDAAEMAWHHNVDLYRHNDCIFKYMFDFPILMAYPDLSVPGENDSHRESMFLCAAPSRMKMFGAPPNVYEYAYRRYRDPAYLPFINNPEERAYLANPTAPPPPPVPGAPAPPPPAPGTPPPPTPIYSERHINLAYVGVIPPSLLYDLDPAQGTTIPLAPSVNYPVVGYGILRTPAADGSGQQGLTLSYGPSASHGHPDKLHIDLYALNDVLMPSPGVNFPYGGNIRLPKWYHTTIAHNTLTVDEKIQDTIGANPKSTANADQVVFAPALTVGLQRAWTDSVYPGAGVTMDRAVFMTSNYLADIFGAFSAAPHKYDFAWHIRGDATSDLTFSPITFDQSINGYNWFTSARAADATDKPINIISTNGDKVARLHLAGGSPTQAIIGEGGIYVDGTTKDTDKPTCPTIIERRDKITSTLYGNALDFSGSKDGYVKDITQEGSLDAGYALLKVTTSAGTDQCFASYRPGSYTAGSLKTDALQAFVQMNGQDVQTLYLAGGKTLQMANASITRSETGLAYVEKTATGSYLAGNPSPAAATVTVTLPALAGMKAFNLDDAGKRTGPTDVQKGSTPGSFMILLKASSRVEFASS